MNAAWKSAGAAGLAIAMLAMQGCLFTTRRLPVPRAPDTVQSAAAAELVEKLNKRWETLDSLAATVQIQASVMKTKEGLAKDYTSFPGIILMRKPDWLRVYGRVPVIGTRMFDMVSDGKNFTLYVPSKSIAYKGPNTLTRKSTNAVENMRPGFFLDSILVRGISADDYYTAIADTDVTEDAKKKHLLLTPEYILTIMQPKPGTHEMAQKRVIHFHREDLLPYQQDLYDAAGNLETEVRYGRYAQFGDNLYPSTVTIVRPLEDYQIVMTVEKVSTNLKLTDSQFQVQFEEGTRIQNLE